MAPSRKQQVIDLLKSLETKDPVPLAYVNPNKYIQHNLQVGPGPAGVAALIQNMPPDASVNTIRVFEDGDYVFAHTQYNFFGPRIGFDIFRYEDSLIVEHWDNLQETATEPSPSGHTMIDGPTIASDLDKTDANKALMQRYMEDLLAGRRETFPRYFNGTQYIQHNPWVADTIPGLIAGLQALAAKGQAVVYKSVHKILGEGNFVLVVAEATFGGVPTGIYDLFRIEKGRIAEHWDTLEAIPPRAVAARVRGDISAEDFAALKADIPKTTADIQEQIKAFDTETSTLESMMVEAKTSVLNLSKHWAAADTPQKQELQRALFPDGLMVSKENGHFERGNTSLMESWQLFLNSLEGSTRTDSLENKFGRGERI